jgi:hypothetical protein
MRVGFAAPARPTFDVTLAGDMVESAWDRLAQSGHPTTRTSGDLDHLSDDIPQSSVGGGGSVGSGPWRL